MAQYIEFTPEQKERAATVDLEDFLLRQGEKLIKSGREKRLASDHSVTVHGCEWFDHASNEGGRAVSFIQKYYGKSYVEAMSMLLGESMEPVYPQAKSRNRSIKNPLRRLFRMQICTAYLRICSKHEVWTQTWFRILPAGSYSMRTRRITTPCSLARTKAAVRATRICAARTVSARHFV